MKLKTSVALCTYNGEKYLAEQLDSILNQTIPVDEIIVCDDRSDDNTISILNDYQSSYPGLFKIHINDKNLKSVKNFEKAIRLCTNDIIFLCDQDDSWQKNKVEEFIKVFNDHPEVKVVASSGNYYDGIRILENKTSVWDISRLIKENISSKIDYFELIAAITNIATGAAMAIKKDIVPEIPDFPEIENIHHDELIALIAARNDAFYFLDKKLFNYRIHVEQQVGINFFDFDTDKMDYLLKPYKKGKSFENYKRLLKLISGRYKFYNPILKKLKSNPYYYDLFSSMQNICKDIFYKNKKEMIEKYPIKSRLLQIADFITKKRNL